MRHLPFAIGQAARDRWVANMDRALDEAQLPAEAAQVLRTFFAEIATFMINRD
jgi:hemoglobin